MFENLILLAAADRVNRNALHGRSTGSGDRFQGRKAASADAAPGLDSPRREPYFPVPNKGNRVCLGNFLGFRRYFMKVVFPTEEMDGLDSRVFEHFGSAAGFVVVDTDSNAFELRANPDREHTHGRCQPLKALGGDPVDAVVVGGIGGGALRKLQLGGIKVYRAVEGTVRDNLELVRVGKLPEFELHQTCAGHSGLSGCIH
jgi:predicted Fe-Mo cluster-binding NifX family protein